MVSIGKSEDLGFHCLSTSTTGGYVDGVGALEPSASVNMLTVAFGTIIVSALFADWWQRRSVNTYVGESRSFAEKNDDDDDVSARALARRKKIEEIERMGRQIRARREAAERAAAARRGGRPSVLEQSATRYGGPVTSTLRDPETEPDVDTPPLASMRTRQLPYGGGEERVSVRRVIDVEPVQRGKQGTRGDVEDQLMNMAMAKYGLRNPYVLETSESYVVMGVDPLPEFARTDMPMSKSPSGRLSGGETYEGIKPKGAGRIRSVEIKKAGGGRLMAPEPIKDASRAQRRVYIEEMDLPDQPWKERWEVTTKTGGKVRVLPTEHLRGQALESAAERELQALGRRLDRAAKQSVEFERYERERKGKK